MPDLHADQKHTPPLALADDLMLPRATAVLLVRDKGPHCLSLRFRDFADYYCSGRLFSSSRKSRVHRMSRRRFLLSLLITVFGLTPVHGPCRGCHCHGAPSRPSAV